MRGDGRPPGSLRAISIVPNVSPYAEGSVEVAFGNTKLLVTATVEQETPRWMTDGSGGWITAEYGMLPRSTNTRCRREAASGKQEGRTLEIQRLIGRALRQAIDLKQLEGLTIRLDCDVLVADGGTRTAAISGAWVALAQAIRWLQQRNLVGTDVALRQIAAVSVGIVGGMRVVDLCYAEDSQADFDLNLVFTESGELIEIQGTAERASMPLTELQHLLSAGLESCKEIMNVQRRAVSAFEQ